MCSRYFLDDDGNVIAYTFRVPLREPIRRRFNIAPTQVAPVVRVGADGERELAMLRWGLVPFWAKDLSAGNRMINARCETVAEKPAFREALKKRRCIVPASGFFEWTGSAGHRIPHAITVEGCPLVAMAGLWECWKDAGGAPVETFTILTTEANGFMSALHDRMPAILPPENIDDWLEGPTENACRLIRPYDDAPMRERTVSRLLNSPDNESEALFRMAEPRTGNLLEGL
jgi:putative SOS response-associated peptidase YedK